jgi:hypothetical protein
MHSLLADTDFPLLPVAIGGGIGALLAVFLLVWLLRKRPAVKPVGSHGEDMASYPLPPPVQNCQLFYLNEPVRVRLLILAPLGRRDLPEDVETLLDRSVRGLGAVLSQDRPAWRTWAPQLSWKGFLPTFTRYVQLPTGEKEPSEFQLVCGQIRLGGQMVVLGLVLRSDEALHRQTRLLEAHQWVEQFRVEWYS